jgi:hypothetical protein
MEKFRNPCASPSDVRSPSVKRLDNQCEADRRVLLSNEQRDGGTCSERGVMEC